MKPLPIALLVLGAATVALALVLTARRVGELERGELEHESTPRSLATLASAVGSTRVSARLTSVKLRRGERALFELCSADRLEPALWQDQLELAVFRLDDMGLMLRVPLDAAHLAVVRRSGRGACLRLGGGDIERDGRYAVDAVWPAQPPRAAVRSVPLRARVLGRTPLVASDLWLIVALFCGALLGIAACFVRDRPGAAGATHPGAQGRSARPGLASLHALLPLAAVAALTQLETASTLETLWRGLSLVLLQGVVPWLLARALAVRDGGAALRPPARPVASALLALGAAGLLVGIAQLSLALVPSTSEAPIQSFVSWPSGLLCFAALGVLLPLGEELLFRGYLWSALRALGRSTGLVAAITLLAFVLLHLPQTWGNWGGLLAIAATGCVLTALRAATGSVLVPALAHVLYNFALSLASF